jgi:hypothetical protein
VNVEISTATPKAAIYYTTDGSTATAASNLYTGPIAVTATTTIHAVGIASGYDPSLQLEATYTIRKTPFGETEQAYDCRTGGGVLQSDNLCVSGWAIDPPVGAPVSQVQILIDGKAVGNATLGIPRPDIAALYPNLANDLNSGWKFVLPASGLALGSHWVNAIAYRSANVSTTLSGPNSVKGVQFGVVPPSRPFGTIDVAYDLRTGSTTVAQSDALWVSGWAMDPQDGAPVSKVQILIDGNVAGNATLGIARPVICQHWTWFLLWYNWPIAPNCLDSGWTFTMPASGLSLGTHTIAAVIYDSFNLSSTAWQSVNITVATTSTGAPIGLVEGVYDLRTGSTTVAQSDSLRVSGWAMDLQDGAPVSKVQILINGSVVGNATLGIARPEIAALYPQFQNNLHSGWTFTMPASGLYPGVIYEIGVVAYDSLNLSTMIGFVDMPVATTSTGPPIGLIEGAYDLRTGLTTVAQSDSLRVSGWAMDPQDGAPLSKVQILVDGNVAGNATLGIARPVIAALYPYIPNNLHSGWTFTMPASGLTPGKHTITAVAYDSLSLSGTLSQYKTWTINVSP